MAFGVKMKTIKTSRDYTVEEFFDAIKDKEFEAGKPEYVKQGLAYLIAFPALDSQNQVQIVRLGKGKFMVQKAEQAGVGNLLKNAAIDSATGGIFGMKKMVGQNAKRCEELVEITKKELEALGL